jgi:hypothetical protein
MAHILSPMPDRMIFPPYVRQRTAHPGGRAILDVTAKTNSDMKTQADNSSYLVPLITGVAVILFSTAVLPRMMGWGANLPGDSGGVLASGGGPASRVSCAGCGMIESVREIDARGEFNGLGPVDAAAGEYVRLKSTKSYAIAVRLFDGSSRVITDASPARWRAGEYVIVIDGADRSSR